MALRAAEGVELKGLAGLLTEGFIRGEYNEQCAATLRTLLPGISHTSISVAAGDKRIVTEENLLNAGFASIHFERIDGTVSGQALLNNNQYEANISSPRSFSDLDRAHSSGQCTTLVSLPIARPKTLGRRASFDAETQRPSPSTMARGSITSGGGATTQDDCSEHFGAFSQRREQAPMGCITIGLREHAQPTMTHLNSLRLLAELLSPILEEQSRTLLDGLKSAFGQSRVDNMARGVPEPDAEEAQGCERWNSAQGADDMVDSMMRRR